VSGPDVQRTISPIDGSVCVQRALADEGAVESVLAAAQAAKPTWAGMPLERRAQLCTAMVEHLEGKAGELAHELTVQMGRPQRDSPGELRGLSERARHMIGAAPDALAALQLESPSGGYRAIHHEPLGLVLTIAPWNYPYLTSVNTVVPALLAGNVVVLKHSSQTPLCAERYYEACRAAGFPPGVFQFVHADHAMINRMIGDARVDFVAFTGSVPGGHAVQHAASDRFINLGLELGGKDPAYVREDAEVARAAEALVDGALYNAGQSCCGIERIYVHRRLHDEFVEAFVAGASSYVLGDPTDPQTTLGPMVRTAAADFVRGQTAAAVASGARALVDHARFPHSRAGTAYLAPQVLAGVDHSMAVMRDESFGPVVGIMAVDDDAQAVELMNDSEFGLTASIWTGDLDTARALGGQLQTGTVFMNRCDYLDPALAWTGVKDSGRGCTLSSLGFAYLTRPKSFNFSR